LIFRVSVAGADASVLLRVIPRRPGSALPACTADRRRRATHGERQAPERRLLRSRGESPQPSGDLEDGTSRSANPSARVARSTIVCRSRSYTTRRASAGRCLPCWDSAGGWGRPVPSFAPPCGFEHRHKAPRLPLGARTARTLRQTNRSCRVRFRSAGVSTRLQQLSRHHANPRRSSGIASSTVRQWSQVASGRTLPSTTEQAPT
jgi:hypothetical protein